jgi:uncharacterized phage protein (TIGR01671 family)
MRELKYKVWDTKEKRFYNESFSNGIYPEDGNFTFYIDMGGNISLFSDNDGGKSGLWEHETFVEKDRYIPVFYIGLKDKNGKEIYEGDIVHHHRYGFNWEVVYSSKNTGYDLINNEHEGMHLSDLCQPNIEVIGNIYESPELLK